MFLGNLGASVLGNLLAGKIIVRARSGNKKGKGIVRAGTRKRLGFSMPSHPLTNLELERIYQNEPRFNGVFSRDNLIIYVINLDEYADVGTHLIDLFCNRNETVYFDGFGVENVSEEIKEFVGNKNIIANIFRVQTNNSLMCGYFCIGFIDFMLESKKLTNFTNLFFPYDFRKKDHIILTYFEDG